ncbi:MAG: phBC6A51 family helix-turn-helix protein [Paraclostridium sp.]
MNEVNGGDVILLNEVQLECIELMAQGNLTNKEIANTLKISDRVIYKWKKVDEFKSALDMRTLEFQEAIKNQGKLRITAKGQMAIDNIVSIANTARSEKVKLDANMFIYEAIFGKATTKIEEINENNNDKDNGPTWEELKSNDNVISIKDKVK